MNNNYYDREEIYCPTCNFRWILVSDREITDYQHNVWIQYVYSLHETMENKKEELE